jgi:hypothetical protein
MKTCRTCNKTLELEQFYKHGAMKDGRLNHCINCVKTRVRDHRKENLETVRLYDRQRGKTEERRERARDYAKNNRELLRKIKATWAAKNKEKKRAHLKVKRAKEKGLITQGCCEVCGNFKSEAHHEDYSKPLEVVWLCRKHHAELHRKYKDE